MRGSVRAFLAVLLLALFPVFVVALGVGGVVAGIVVGGRGGIYLAIVSLGLMVALGFALVQALRTRLTPPDGPRMTRQEQPALWQVVDELAARAQTRPPDEIILVPEINAAVQEDARGLGLRAGRRYMMIGLPLLAGLNVSELRSVLAHELGHYGGGHTRMLAISYRGAETLSRTVSRLDSGPARWVLNGYAWLYRVISQSARRTQELQADAYSVAAAGQRTAIDALRKIATMSLFWNAFGERFLHLPVLSKRTPDILLGFRTFLDHPEQQRIMAEVEPQVLDTEPSSVFDSHPTIRRRIAAIQALPDNPAPPDARPAWAIVLNPAQVLPAAEGALYINGEIGPRASWADIVRVGAAESAFKGAETLARAAHESGAAPSGTLGEILQAVGRGETPRLLGPLLRDGVDPHEAADAMRSAMTELLGDVVVAALVSQGRARHELNWGGPWRVIGPAGELSPDDLIGPAVANPALVGQLVAKLNQLGVPLDFVRRPAPPDPARQAQAGVPRLTAVAPAIMAFKKMWDGFVTDAGLLLIPLKAGGLASQSLAGAMGQAGQAGRKRLNDLLANGPEALFARPDARWLRTQDILGGERKSLMTGGGKFVIQLTDGTSVTVRTDVDEVYEVLTEFVESLPQHTQEPAGR
ncbi:MULTISPECIES: M48 family metallopeptidase [Actinoalloteichus]|uniref:Zn-dependent protease with chaperone function n=1 Tax=Actinoalloteichus fjordicus TaxID=1612552 RepID=A0AAC9PQX8_9PSEU|nr:MULTISPECIES: M48 family metallopeptidase [Actinoalloteichus]APU13251.1 Zn-dependent protease with chaperone function [Actinoalloteichus fjordicus]APU19202.1 Zn-dependent protease with chaperone function [Actinoalloteichus sp. GBA129-24]